MCIGLSVIVSKGLTVSISADTRGSAYRDEVSMANDINRSGELKPVVLNMTKDAWEMIQNTSISLPSAVKKEIKGFHLEGKFPLHDFDIEYVSLCM